MRFFNVFTRVKPQFRRWAPICGGGAALMLYSAYNYNFTPARCADASEPWNRPLYSTQDVRGHNTKEKRIWVTFEGGVYDVTDFVDSHPGGTKIMMAAGGALEPFWRLDDVHNKKRVRDLLGTYRIGDLKAECVTEPCEDPYGNDPIRHPGLVVRSSKPFCAEVPNDVLEHWVTPSELWFVRSHHPVPEVPAEADYAIEVQINDHTPPVRVTLEDLRTKFPKQTVTVTTQCAGNRRSEFNTVRPTVGNNFGSGAISTAVWGGVRLRDVLKYCGFTTSLDEILENSKKPGTPQHIKFDGFDAPYDASVTIEKAISPAGDVLLAYEMNGGPLPRDHGYPLRAVVPGHLGARSVKWLKKVTVSPTEASGIWQTGIPYKGLPPHVTNFKGVDVSTQPSAQDMPVQSGVTTPADGSEVSLAGDLLIKGFAYSGGGRGILRVDVTGNGGRDWVTATVKQGPSAEDVVHNRAWQWTLWEAALKGRRVDVRDGMVRICSKAVDTAYNTQPESPASIWNLRGIDNNAWACVNLKNTEDQD